MSVLIVDDEVFIIKLIQKILGKLELSSESANNGEEAIRVLNNHFNDIELAIVDMTMPGMNGFETVRNLKKIKPELICIISSGQRYEPSDIPEDLRESLYFLQKPYHVKIFMDFVTDLLKTTA